MSKLAFRNGHDGDLELVDHIYNEGLKTEIVGAPEMKKHFIRMPSGKTRVLEVDGAPVGFVNVNDADLRYIYVLPEHHGKGYGRALMEEGLSLIEGKARLLVYTNNEKAQNLYRSFGFSPVENGVANGLCVFVREKEKQS